MAFVLSSVVGGEESNNGSSVDSNSRLLQLPGRDLISLRQRDISEIALSQDFTTASHRVSARCCPEASLPKLICQKQAELQEQYCNYFIFPYDIKRV